MHSHEHNVASVLALAFGNNIGIYISHPLLFDGIISFAVTNETSVYDVVLCVPFGTIILVVLEPKVRC